MLCGLLTLLMSLLFSPSAIARTETNAIFRIDGVLSGPGGGPWGEGGTKIESSGASASFGGGFGVAAAAEVKVVDSLWLEAGASRFDSVNIEIIRSHGIGNPFETYNGKISLTSWILGIDLRPQEWDLSPDLQFGAFVRYLQTSFGRPPPSANVLLASSAGSINVGARVDMALSDSKWLIGVDLSFGSPEPTVSDPSASTSRKVEAANFHLAIGPRFRF